MRCSHNRRVTAGLLLSFLTLIPNASAIDQAPLQPLPASTIQSNEHIFTLQNIFHRGLYKYPNVHKRLDIKPEHDFVIAYDGEPEEHALPPRLRARSSPMQIQRLVDRRHEVIAEHLEYSSLTGGPRVLGAEHWTMDELPAPNVTDKETVLNLAIMAANAYCPVVGAGEWEDVLQGFNLSTPFGWETDGLRGYIFADEGNKTVIVAMKGTSPAVFDGEGTTTNDKVNDNLFFSCCCGQGGRWLWKKACDCMSSTESYTCNNTCLVQNLKEKTKYYTAALELFTNVSMLYPQSNLWITGHSLGGSVSSMIGLTYGLPVVTFEAPGDDLPSRRLGLPVPDFANPFHPYQRPYTGARHFGHTADPIFMGTCNGLTSLCTLGGYAMESQCHTGKACVYDTVNDLSWRVSAMYHRVHEVINNVITKYDHVPVCEPDAECVDCFNWKFFNSNGSIPAPPSSTTTIPTTTKPIRTRTEICKTPGWWRCLDEPSSTSVIATTYTTTSCANPGWFGCNELVNVTITTTTAAPTPVITTTYTTTTCVVKGWFGCYDKELTTVTTTTVPPGSTSTCKTPGFFWGCWDDDDTSTTSQTGVLTNTVSITSVPPVPTTTHPASKECTVCETPGWLWGCYDTSTHYCSTSAAATPGYSITMPTPTASLTTSTQASSPPLPPQSKPTKKPDESDIPHEPDEPHGCKHPYFFGLFCGD